MSSQQLGSFTRRRALGLGLLTLLTACGGEVERGADLAIGLAPAQVSFPSIAVGAEDSVKVTLTHTGRSGTLRLTTPVMSTSSSDFAVGPLGRTALEPGESTTFTITYHPSDTVYDQGVVYIGHNILEKGPITVPVRTGAQTPLLSTVPAYLDFGELAGGETQKLAVVASNVGTAPLVIEKVGFDIIGGAAFTVVDLPSLPATLMPGKDLTLNVRFAPSAVGSDRVHQANLRFITTSAESSNRVVPVRGVERHPRLVVTPAQVDFGWVPVGGTALADVTLRNAAADALTVESVALTGAHAKLTAIGLPPGPVVLAPQETRTVTLRFSPVEALEVDTALGTLDVKAKDWVVTARSVPVRGKAAQPAVRLDPPELVDFGIVGIGYTHERTVLVLNDGPVPLTVLGVTLTADTAKGFLIDSGPIVPVTLAPKGGRTEVRLTYTNVGDPDGQGVGTLSVKTDDPVKPVATVSLLGRNTAAGRCIPHYEPPSLYFGLVGPGNHATETITLVNEGSLPCTWAAMSFVACASPSGLCQPSGASSVFSVAPDGPPPGRHVFFGERLDIPIVYTPSGTSGEDAALAVAALVDGYPPAAIIQHVTPEGGLPPTLRGAVGNSGVHVQPTAIDFGLAPVGCGTESAPVGVTRLGPLKLDLATVDFSGCAGQFVWKGLPTLPAPLYEDAAAAILFNVQFLPTSAGAKSCIVAFKANTTEAGVATLALSGVATAEKERTEYFQQKPEYFADIVFVVDNSGSMGDEQNLLATGFAGFLDQAKTWNVQYRIAVVTTDIDKGKGRFVGPPQYVTNADPTPFVTTVKVGTKGSGDEQGLRAAWLAFQPDVMAQSTVTCNPGDTCAPENGTFCVGGTCGGPNHAFVREDATLVVIWLSDEQDHSPGAVDDYVAFLKGVKPNGAVRGYAIVGDAPTDAAPLGGCGGWKPGGGGKGSGAEAGTRYSEAAKALGGFSASICSFGKTDGTQPSLLDEIGKDAFKPVDTFELKGLPDPKTLVLKVNGTACADGWTYDAAKNAVVFTSSATCFPGASSVIEVTYSPLCYTLE